jgi:hypothetical protein
LRISRYSTRALTALDCFSAFVRRQIWQCLALCLCPNVLCLITEGMKRLVPVRAVK